MSFDPGPIERVVFNLPDMQLARLLSRFQDSVASWADRLRGGTGWTDLQGLPVEGLSTSALTTDELIDNSGAMVKCFRHDQDDDVTYTKQFQHQWDMKEVHPHVHVVPLAEASGNLAFRWKYAWIGYQGRLSAMTDGPQVIRAITARDFMVRQDIELGVLTPPAGLRGTSAFLILFVERDSSTDTYATNKAVGFGTTLQANLALLGIDVHHRQRLFGSEGLYK